MSETTLDGYRLDRVTESEPGFLTVYEASEASTGERVAVRAFPIPKERRLRRGFRRAAKLRAGRAHAGLLPGRAALEQEGQLYLVTEHSSAPTLASRLERGPLDPEAAVRVLVRVAEVLDQVEWVADGILSPAGILVEAADGSGAVLADPPKAVSLREVGWPWVHPHFHYSAPELGWGEHAGARSSVYTLGCMLFECLSGSRPFEGDWLELMEAHSVAPAPAVSKRRPALGTALDPVIARAMAKEPDDRFASPGELMRAAAAALEAGEGSAAGSTSAAEPVLAPELHPDDLEPLPSIEPEPTVEPESPAKQRPAAEAPPLVEPDDPVFAPHPDAVESPPRAAPEPTAQPTRARATARPPEARPDAVEPQRRAAPAPSEQPAPARPTAPPASETPPDPVEQPAAAKVEPAVEPKPQVAVEQHPDAVEPKPEVAVEQHPDAVEPPTAAEPTQAVDPEPARGRSVARVPEDEPTPVVEPEPQVGAEAAPEPPAEAEAARDSEAPAKMEPPPPPVEPKPPAIEPEPPAVEPEPRRAERKPFAVEPEPRRAERKPRAVEPEPRRAERKPRAVEPEPRPAERKPRAVEPEPRPAERKRPAVQRKRRLGGRKARAVERKPPAVEPKPAAEEPPSPEPARSATRRRPIARTSTRSRPTVPADRVVEKEPEMPSKPTERASASRRRGRPVVLACVAAVACALAGYLAGTAAAPESVPAKAAAAGPVSLKLPADWQRRPAAGALPRAELRTAIAAGPRHSRDAGVVVGRTGATGKDFLPAGLTAPRGHAAEPVRLGRYDAYRHGELRVAGARREITAYAIPTAGGAAVVACHAAPTAARRFLPACERVASTLDLRGLRTVPLSILVAERRRLAETVAELRRRRSTGRRALAEARRPTTQARQARRLEAAYRDARASLAKLDAAAEPPGWQARLTTAVRRVEAAYRRLGRAAARRSRRRYDAARRSVSRSESALAALLARAAAR